MNLPKINWFDDTFKNARLVISDGAMTSYISEAQLPERFFLRDIAEAYASAYDHNGNDSSFAICTIEDLDDGEDHVFAFDGRGNFEWDTRRQYVS